MNEKLKKYLNNENDYCFNENELKKEINNIIIMLQYGYILENCCIDGEEYYFLTKNYERL